MNVAIIGASNKEQRYSYKAVMLLKEKGHDVYPVHLRVKEIEGIHVYRSVRDIKQSIDTMTIYVGKELSQKIAEDIFAKKPKRIIFNPGAENPDLEQQAKRNGIETINACTLVMLKTGQF